MLDLGERDDSGDPRRALGHPPRFNQPFDLEAHCALFDVHTARGMFFNDILERVQRAHSGTDLVDLARIGRRRFVPFASYPYADLVRLYEAAARVFHPAQPRGEGLRRIGWHVYDAFIGTMVGSAIFEIVKGDVGAVLINAGRAYAISCNFGKVSTERTGPRSVRMQYRSFPGMIETYQIGVIEGAVKNCGETPTCTIELRDLANADIDVSW
jgi:uncharacterized protein (TIGR02265 family)